MGTLAGFSKYLIDRRCGRHHIVLCWVSDELVDGKKIKEQEEHSRHTAAEV